MKSFIVLSLCLVYVTLAFGGDVNICTVPVNGQFVFPDLPYTYDALEPFIDELTMKLHHDKHFNDYTTKINAAVKGTVMEGLEIPDLLNNYYTNSTVRNMAGGFYNHC